MLIEHPQAWGHDGLPGILFQCLTIPSVKNTLSLSFPSPPSFFFFSLFSCSIFLFFIFYFFFFPLFFFSFLFLFFLFVFTLFPLCFSSFSPPALFVCQAVAAGAGDAEGPAGRCGAPSRERAAVPLRPASWQEVGARINNNEQCFPAANWGFTHL